MAAAAPTVRAQSTCAILSSPDCAVLALRQRIDHA
jgi:hypothetical protein